MGPLSRWGRKRPQTPGPLWAGPGAHPAHPGASRVDCPWPQRDGPCGYFSGMAEGNAMRVLRAAAAVLFIALAGCPAVYPELGTRTRPMAPGAQLDPPPPSDLHWIKFVSARIPERTRDGRPWQPNGKASPYAKLLVNGVELIKSGTQSDTLEPTWPEGPHGNFKVAA